jgi:DNA-binding MarR family transcriptional regulator
MTKKIDNKVYYQVAGWMINDLHLTGQELICYAIIYSLSQLGQGRYNAGLEYLSTFMQCSQPTASKALKGLQAKKLIDKEEVITDYGRRVLYYCTNPDEKGDKKNTNRGVNKKFMDGVNKEFIDNNINNKEDNSINKKRLSNDNQKNKYSEEFEHFWKLYDYVRGKQKAYAKWNKLSDADKQKAIDAIPAYKEDCARNKRDMQYAATYLYNHTFEDDFSAKPRRAFYDILESDTDRVKAFKKWMREKFPDIENTCLPLSFEDGKELIERYRTEDVEYVLGEINREFYMYRFKSIAEVAKNMLQDYDEKEDEQ